MAILAAASTMAAFVVHAATRRPSPTAREAPRPVELSSLASVALNLLPWRRRADTGRVWARVAERWAAELRAGATPLTGLARALDEGTPAMARAARSIVLGADPLSVLANLDDGDRRGGAAALRACWSLTLTAGGAAAETVQRAADALLDEASVRDEIRAQLAAPKATARLVAALPLTGPLLGALMGVDAARVLASTPAGHGLLLTGLALNGMGIWWVGRLVRSAEHSA